MASGATLKVRFVRCPKCRLVLPEVADVPVYKCGGCETILVAKNRQTNGRNIIPLKETGTSDTSKEVCESEHKEPISSNLKEVLASNGEFLSDKENGNHQDTSKDWLEENPDLALSNVGKQNGRYQSYLNSACPEHTGIESNGDQELDGDYTKKRNGSVNCASKQPRMNLSEDEDEDEDEVGSKQDKISHMHAHRLAVSNKDYSYNRLVHNDNDGQSSPVAGKSALHINGLSSGIGVKHKESNDDSKVRSLSSVGQITPGGTGSTIPANGPKTESISSEDLTSPGDEQIEQPLEINQHEVSRLTSVDTFYTVDDVGPSSELSGAIGYMSKSTTVGSSQTYEDSVSSCDGMDDPVLDKRMDPFENSYEVPKHYVIGERTRRDKFLSGSTKCRTSGVHHQARNFPPDGAKYKWHQDKSKEHTMPNHPVRSWARFGRAEYPYEIPIPQRAPFSGYESGSTSIQMHDEFSRRSNFHSLDEPEDTEKEKMKLLRMVYELQDQLQKSSFFNGRASSEVSWSEKQFPLYHDYEAPEKEVLYPSYPERNMMWSNWSQQRDYSHIPFSGNTVNSRLRGERSYHPKDWRSAPLPPQALHHNRAFSRMHTDHGFYNPHSSWPSSPQRFVRSEFPIQSYEVMSDDQRYKDRVVNKYPRGKPVTAKRHLRPTAGGAPLATCSSCMSLLQLPVDFLLFKRGVHRLKCGVCSAILKFSIENRKYLVPYDPIAKDPPKGELHDYRDTMKQRSPNAYPTSCSDDYGVSFCKSYSTEGEPSSVAPPCEPPRTYIHEESQNKHKSPTEAYVSARTSISEPSDTEELPRRGDSPLGPLHRLMGYSSISQVFKGAPLADSSKYSYYSGESSQRAVRFLKG